MLFKSILVPNEKGQDSLFPVSSYHLCEWQHMKLDAKFLLKYELPIIQPLYDFQWTQCQVLLPCVKTRAIENHMAQYKMDKQFFFMITEILMTVRLQTTITTSTNPMWVILFMYSQSIFLSCDHIIFAKNVYISSISSVSYFLRYINSNCNCISMTADAKTE